MTLKFEDLHHHDANVYYTAPNEDPFMWREMIKNRNIHRVAAICSAGEVGFFSLLPLVRRELVLIDHSYRSLAIAMAKYLLLRERGWRDTLRLLTAPTGAELHATLEELKQHMPEKVRDAFPNRNPIVSYGYVNSEVARMWRRAGNSPRLLMKAARKLDRVSFIHGDLTDLEGQDPFGMLYISNAMEHTSRHGRPLLTQVEKLVKPGGYVVGCSSRAARDRWNTLLTRNGTWVYDLYQVPVKAAA